MFEAVLLYGVCEPWRDVGHLATLASARRPAVIGALTRGGALTERTGYIARRSKPRRRRYSRDESPPTATLGPGLFGTSRELGVAGAPTTRPGLASLRVCTHEQLFTNTPPPAPMWVAAAPRDLRATVPGVSITRLG
ncbi:unnamed protein product, partial [Iphiclides podalirius]